MSRLAGDKLVDTENSVAIRSSRISSIVDFVWKKRNALMSRSLVLPVESFRATVYPIVYAVKSVASSSIEVIKKLSSSSKGRGSSTTTDFVNAERFVGVSDVVSHFAPFLASSLDPDLIFQVGVNMLYLADVPGGKPEWDSASIIAILTLWDRQEYSSARESIVRVVVTSLHLLDLSMQELVLSSVTVGISDFELSTLWVQVLYYPFYGAGAAAYEGDYADDDPQIIRQKKSLRPEMGEPVIYDVNLECTGTYTYEGSGFKATAAQQYGESPFLSGLKSLSSKPFHKVCSHIIRTVAGFQLCYAAKTWYGGFVGMMIFGASEVSRNVDLGDETTTMICKFVVRASDESITKEIGSDLQAWMDDLTDGTIEYMPEDEVKAAAAERLRISMERIAILKAARPRPKHPKSDDEEEEKKEEESDEDVDEDKENGEVQNGKTKKPTTLFKLTPEEVEHRALQAAVLQEWHMLCKDRSTKVN